MSKIIPINGRIAIIDDHVDQALPLMRVLASHNMPYVFYDASQMATYMPEKPENDIRILFLDLNLVGGRDSQPKDIHSMLYTTIKSVISPDNYPYVVILWSRQEKDYKKMLEEIFAKQLSDRAPICIKEYVKSDFFPSFTEKEEPYDAERDAKILIELERIINDMPAYRNVLRWENCVHDSADETIQDLFSDYHSSQDWHDNANCILDLFAQSYLEKQYQNSSQRERARASLIFLNDVYGDTLESNVAKLDDVEAPEALNSVSEDRIRAIVSEVNESVLLSKVYDSIHQPGCVSCFDSGCQEAIKACHGVLNNSISFAEIRNRVIGQLSDPTSPEAKNAVKTEIDNIKKAIKSSLIPVAINVTPACDYAQNKYQFDRFVYGIIIESKFADLINTQSEAIYKSPNFNISGKDSVLVLNYRYFYTEKSQGNPKILFRFRSSVLAEIQSKLARHISRQGVMNLW